MSKYKFDIISGHYVVNEADNVTADGVVDNNTQQEQEHKSVSLINLNSEDVLKVKKAKQVQLENFDKEIQTKKDMALQIQNKIAQLQNSGNATQSALNNLQKELVQINLDIETKIFDKAKKSYDMSKQILELQKNLITEKLNTLKFPEQYKNLNEEDINNNKIYLNNFISENNIIKNINEFKNVFRTSKLLYGTDRNGYFAVCFNNNDINRLQNILSETGYSNDLIIASITPQLI